MATVKQVGLLPAGCQPWNSDVCAASGDRFAYCATLAIYIYELDRQYNEFKLHSIMSEHKKTITSISWCPQNPDLLASASADNKVVVWNIAEQQVTAALNNTKEAPTSLGWCPHDKDVIALLYGRGPLFLWSYNAPSGGVTHHKEAAYFTSEVTCFRWNPKKSGKFALGHGDGSVSIFSSGQRNHKHVLRPGDSDEQEVTDPVVALEWDPLSTEYLLLANQRYGVRLVDGDAVTVIMTFALPSAAAQVHTLAWISSAPGMFLTGDTHTGVMRLWNVSKSTPIENLKLKKTGFHALHVFTTTPGTAHSTSPVPQAPLSSSETKTSSKNCSSRYALPPAHAVCTFLDGGVGLYDLGRRKWHFLREEGHIETIFDCKFKPDNPDLIASASFDGTIKVWDINTLKSVYSSPGNEGVIYSLSWAPADLGCIAACTSRQGAFIWDINKGKVIKRFNEHGKASVYSIAWNLKDSKLIASCGADSFCIIRQVDGKLIMKYKHPGAVFGCDWNPNNKDLLATGCEDKCVRVYYLATATDQPLKVFSGHTAKVFHVKWSPLRDGILCSGSDDGTIRIWDYTADACTGILTGHTAPVRGLLWNSEVPYLLISGSWDYSIRIWDTRDGACIDTVLDHGADVYGLTCHPSRPFVLASCSRDSTLRIWSLTLLVQPLEINLLAGQTWDDILATTEHAMALGTPALLTGKVSRDLKVQIDKLQGNVRARTLRWFSKFFANPVGSDNLWELVSVVQGLEDSLLSPRYANSIMHTKHLTKFRAAVAQELEMVKMSKFGAGIGAPSKEDRLREAADIHIRLGNTQRYCELMVELGQWEKALSVAPAVSLEYWKSLAERRAQALCQEDSDQSVPFCVATGNAELLVKFFSSRGQLQDALTVATAAYEGTVVPPICRKTSIRSADQNGVDSSEDTRLLQHTSEQLADWHFRNGAPILAACCHLAVSDTRHAMSKLIRGHELELAISVGQVLPQVEDLCAVATEMLARRCEKIGRWELGAELLLQVAGRGSLPLAKLCARCAASMAEINDLHSKCGFPSMEECHSRAEALQNQQGDVMDIVKWYLLSSQPEDGLEIGLHAVKERMSRSSWQADDVFDLLQLLGSVKTEKFQHNKCVKLKEELLILCSYVGALVAARRHYDSIVVPLFKLTRKLMKRDGNAEVPLSDSLVSAEMEAWAAYQIVLCHNPKVALQGELSLTETKREMYTSLMSKAGEETSIVGVGMDSVSGTQLPSHSDVHNSCLNDRRIQGPAFFLEDGHSAMSINDAIMWAKVNPFSPLASGVRINPF